MKKFTDTQKATIVTEAFSKPHNVTTTAKKWKTSVGNIYNWKTKYATKHASTKMTKCLTTTPTHGYKSFTTAVNIPEYVIKDAAIAMIKEKLGITI